MGKAPKIWSLLVLSLVAVAVIAGIYTANDNDLSDQKNIPVLQPDNRSLVQHGAEIYAQNCASCHGIELEGEPDWRSTNQDGSMRAPPHDETGHTWHHADELLFRITKFGSAKAVGLDGIKSNMPAYEGSLTDEDLIAVLSWIKAQWPREIRERHDMMNERARNAIQ